MDLPVDDVDNDLFSFNNDEDLIAWLLLNVDTIDLEKKMAFPSSDPIPNQNLALDDSSYHMDGFPDIESSFLNSNEIIQNNNVDVMTDQHTYGLNLANNSNESQVNSVTSSFNYNFDNNDLADSDDDDEDESQHHSKSKRQKTDKSTNSTKKYKETVDELQEKIKKMTEENESLKSHLLTFTQRTTELQRQRIEMETLMAEKYSLPNPPPHIEVELETLVHQFTEMYADYGKCRQKEVSYHLQQLEKLLIPTQTTKMSLWTLQQDKTFYEQQSPLYTILCNELEITTEQTKKIQEHRLRFQTVLSQLKESLSLIPLLKDSIRNKHYAFDSEVGKLQSQLTPRQTIAFILWVRDNSEILAKLLPECSSKGSNNSILDTNTNTES